MRRKSILIICCIVANQFFYSCADKEEVIVPENVKLEAVDNELLFSNEGITVSSSGEEQSFKFNSNYSGKIVNYVGNNKWMHVKVDGQNSEPELEFSTGQHTISIACDANDSYYDRSALFLVRVGDVDKVVKVNQKSPHAFYISQSSFDFNKDGGSFAVDFIANEDYTVEVTEGAAWIHDSKTRTSSGRFVFTVDMNNTEETRKGTISITGTSHSENIQVTQTGCTMRLVTSQEVFDYYEDGGSFSVDVLSDIDYDVVCDSWIKEVTTRAAETRTHTFNVSASNSNRTGSVTFINKKLGIQHVVTVNQRSFFQFTTDEITLYLGDEYCLSFETGDNRSLEYSSSNDNIATVDNYGNITPLAKGTTNIVVKTQDGLYSHTSKLTVKESFIDDIIVTTHKPDVISPAYAKLSNNSSKTIHLMNVWVTCIGVLIDHGEKDIDLAPGEEYVTPKYTIQELMPGGGIVMDASVHAEFTFECEGNTYTLKK